MTAPAPGQDPGTQHAAPAGGDDRSLGEIVGDIAKDLSTLVRQEIDLAKTEAKAEVTKAGKGAGLLGGAGVAGNLFLVFVSLALVFLLDRVMPLDLAALVVALLWGAVAAVMALMGRKKLQEADPTLPATTQTIKEDVQWAKTRNG
ncbi:phage holin family protein [Thalassiella azotivora]